MNKSLSKAMNWLALVAAVISVLLGALWMLQGLGVVHLRPILCFAKCEPIQGASRTSAIVGALVASAGGGLPAA